MEPNDRKKQWMQTALAAFFWLAAWQVASLLIGQVLFLPGPLDALGALARLAPTGAFWQAVFTSLWRIALGFLLGLGLGVLLASLSAAFSFVEILLRPLMLLVRSTPVASFIILALVWVSSRSLSTFISFLMVLPVIYSATYSGIRGADGKLLEMAGVFRIGFWRRVRAIYLPALLPGLLSSCELALGMSWKSGVAAEVIGLPSGTIGERLYQAKIFLQTPELFAWTAVIIALSGVFGKLVLLALKGLAGKLAGSRVRAAQSGRAPAPPAPVDITLSHLYKSYGDQPVLRDFSARLAGGAPTALMGPSGSGKTTLARLVLGLEAPDAGEVVGTLAQRFGCVFQEDRLCEGLSAVANVALALPRGAAVDIPAALAAVGLSSAEGQKPVESLSGGERRRVALVRAVAAPGDVLVLDEAFKGLDADTRRAAFAYIRENIAGRTLLLITHDEAEAEAFCAAVVPVEKLAAPAGPNGAATP